MIKTIKMLREDLSEYKNPDAKVKRLVEAGELVPICKGLYETDKNIPGYYLASSVYGPSYLSFEFALSFHGLIPEAVYNFTCATFEKKKKKQYNTPFGVFVYRDVPGSAYPYEVILEFEQGYSYQIATAEKALCDMLYTVSPLRNLTGLKEYLFNDLRIYKEDFDKLDMEKLRQLSGLYNTQNHKLLRSLIRG